jgi:peptidyl-prolyl cis-trans isomerase-like protein 2
VRALGRKAFVRVRTNKGALNFELHCDLVPSVCDNFLSLARRGYYDGVVFHRLIRSFMLQGGDPTGTGRGGECAWGGKFKDEFHPKLGHSERGVLSMANAGPDTNGSQFFVCFKSCPHLDRKHSVFGKLVGGFDVLTAIENIPCDPKTDAPKDRIAIEGIDVFQDPFPEVEAQEQARDAKDREQQAERERASEMGGGEAANQRSKSVYSAYGSTKGAPSLLASLPAPSVGSSNTTAHSGTSSNSEASSAASSAVSGSGLGVGRYLPGAGAQGSAVAALAGKKRSLVETDDADGGLDRGPDGESARRAAAIADATGASMEPPAPKRPATATGLGAFMGSFSTAGVKKGFGDFSSW